MEILAEDDDRDDDDNDEVVPPTPTEGRSRTWRRADLLERCSEVAVWRWCGRQAAQNLMPRKADRPNDGQRVNLRPVPGDASVVRAIRPSS